MSFDPFTIHYKGQWKAEIMDKFNKSVESIDGEAIMFIDESFMTLRSAEGAFDMLQNFKHIRSRNAINAQMMQKFKDILVQYEKEVCFFYTLF